MNFAVIDKETLTVKNVYWSDTGIDETRPDYTDDVIHVQVPESLNYFDIVAVRAEDGTIQLTEDPAKVQAKLDAQWTSVRAQQRQKLYESDWTCSVTDYEVPNKSDWVTYRAALRDVTTQSDPFNIDWPTAPSA